ncbi:uncharacterized protein [Rutidosis leptorrhynchoides]|uniref:uncharacterized protein n=1 Tax=Rutidosis leptorrhynchoides TaxID=125765 RepID=UPI003A98D719
MISIDDHPPSDPSSSHHHQHHHHHLQQQVSHDLKSCDIDLKFTDADLDDTNNNQLPKFSIRDYVFGFRSKDIVTNWPFSTTSLQLCLKHGVKNLLPPFESIDSLRNKSSLTKSGLENRLTDEKLIDSFDGKPTNEFKSMEKQKLDSESVTTISGGSNGQRSKVQKLPSSHKQVNASSVHIRKSKFVVKLNSGIERVEEIVPTSFIVSETMASKVCPVCKIFSSSSNTTLNAHIDQCLIGEGTMKWTDSSKVIVKHKVKPRKMRLMVDVYKTAPHCTIEELDRRNGTSWATNSSFPSQEFQFQGEEEDEEDPKTCQDDEEEDNEDPKTFQDEEEEGIEEPKTFQGIKDPKTTIVTSKVADNEGEVYIDTNGTKVRILSVPKAGIHKAQKLVKGAKGCKLIINKKKNSIYKQKHYQKVLKFSPNSKKLCSAKPQARSGLEEDDVMVKKCIKDDYVKESMKVVDLGIVRPPWACSKRTGLLKKFSSKNRKMELQRHEKKDLFVESDKSFSKCDLGINKKMRISLSLIKQPLKSSKLDSRKEGKRMHDDDDDDGDDDDDDDSGDDCRSPDASSQHSDSLDTRSKGKKFSSLTDNRSFPPSEINSKRKFSALEESWDKSVDESSQDSFKEQSVSKKNEYLRSVTSKSSNEDSYVAIQSVNVNKLCDVESVRNEALSFVQAPSFMGLSNSSNTEFSKQECIDQLYQDQICSTNHAPNDVEKHESYFQMVDPIPIPGPPGSFLPASPGGDSVSEEQIQETRILSSENVRHHHDTTENQDSMSNSPVSTVSNSRSTSVQDDTYIKSSFDGLSHDSFKNDQPCCCSRKEAALNYQELFNVSKQPIESNRSFPRSFAFKSEMFSETVCFPTDRRSPVSNDCDVAVSPSKPVLRLMGKNLTVIKTDDDEFRPPKSSQPPPERPVVFSHFQNRFDSQHYNVHPWSNTRSNVDLRPNFGGFMLPMDRYARDGFYLGPNGPQVTSQHGHNGVNIQASGGRNGYSDFPRNESDDSMRNEYLKRNQGQTNQLYAMYPPYLGGGGFQTSLGNGDFRRLDIGSLSSSSSSSHLQPSRSHYPRGYP